MQCNYFAPLHNVICFTENTSIQDTKHCILVVYTKTFIGLSDKSFNYNASKLTCSTLFDIKIKIRAFSLICSSSKETKFNILCCIEMEKKDVCVLHLFFHPQTFRFHSSSINRILLSSEILILCILVCLKGRGKDKAHTKKREYFAINVKVS